jgi:hypothetical protein
MPPDAATGGGGMRVYFERGGFMLHLWLRRPSEFRWGYTLRVRDRYLLFGGRR